MDPEGEVGFLKFRLEKKENFLIVFRINTKSGVHIKVSFKNFFLIQNL
jgi:hypothetical protein